MAGSIRVATAADAARIMEIATGFNERYGDHPLNPDKARTSLDHIIQEGVVLCSDTAAIVGDTYEDPFRDRTLLLEIGWYAEEHSRDGLILLKRFIAEGRKQKVDAIIMSTLTASSDRTRKLLERLGFVTTEYAHTLELGE